MGEYGRLYCLSTWQVIILTLPDMAGYTSEYDVLKCHSMAGLLTDIIQGGNI